MPDQNRIGTSRDATVDWQVTARDAQITLKSLCPC